jgi:uncharacterized membrane protein HdeD (DUF308 family)
MLVNESRVWKEASMPEWLGKSEGYVALAGVAVIVASIMLLCHRLDGGQWVQATLGVLGIICAGGAAAAYRK